MILRLEFSFGILGKIEKEMFRKFWIGVLRKFEIRLYENI